MTPDENYFTLRINSNETAKFDSKFLMTSLFQKFINKYSLKRQRKEHTHTKTAKHSEK